MIWSLPLAFANPSPDTPSEPQALRAPPIRAAIGSRFRTGTQAAAHFEVRVQPVRANRITLDASIGFTPQHRLNLVGPPRAMATVDLGLDLGWEPSPWLALGPTVGVAYRTFHQQGTWIRDVWTPIAGASATLFFMRGRRWGAALRTRALVDLSGTELVLDTAAVEDLTPVEATLALEFHFGHGRVLARPADRP